MFWVEYGGHIGFDVRKRCINLSKFDGKATSCRFVCSNEGIRRKGQTDREPKHFRAETRTNCRVQMVIRLDRAAENYEVTDVELEHNHYLQLPQTRHLLAACCRVLDGNNKFAITIGSLHGDLLFEEEHIVIGDPLTQKVSCSCGMFNRTGILCGHDLKVLDLMKYKDIAKTLYLKEMD